MPADNPDPKYTTVLFFTPQQWSNPKMYKISGAYPPLQEKGSEIIYNYLKANQAMRTKEKRVGWAF